MIEEKSIEEIWEYPLDKFIKISGTIDGYEFPYVTIVNKETNETKVFKIIKK